MLAWLYILFAADLVHLVIDPNDMRDMPAASNDKSSGTGLADVPWTVGSVGHVVGMTTDIGLSSELQISLHMLFSAIKCFRDAFLHDDLAFSCYFFFLKRFLVSMAGFRGSALVCEWCAREGA